jgi:uncharacterized metal-binding protein
MPSARTHDAITVALAVPTAALAWYVTRDSGLVATVTLAELFGGLMFGPDLDTVSRPYLRWGPARFLWFPYRAALRHRSRFSHGVVFGAAIRVVYFLAVIAVVVGLALAARDVYVYRLPASIAQLWQGLDRVWAVMSGIEPRYLLAAFGGLWWGAASHTLADIIGTTLKQIWHAL